MSELVSIIVNCYNGEKYLKKTLESIQKQIYKNWELIFWDNKSTDNSKDIFQSFSDPRFKYYYSATILTNLRFLGPLTSNCTLPSDKANRVWSLPIPMLSPA